MLVSSTRRRKALVFFALVLAASVRLSLAGRIDIDSSTITTVIGTDKSRTAAVSLIIDDEDVDLFQMPSLTLPSMERSDGDAQIVYIKTESITRKAQGELEVVWKGSISDSGRIGFATLMQSSHGIAGTLDSETSAFTLSTMPGGTLQLQETFWEDAQESDSIEFDGVVADLEAFSSEAELVSAVVTDNPKSEVVATSRGNGVKLSGPGRMLRDGDRKLDSMTNVDVLVIITNRAACESAGLSYGCELTGEIIAPIEGLLKVAEEQTNTAMQAVRVSASVTFVKYSFLSPSYDGFPDQAALEVLRTSPTVEKMRNEAGADLVSMITGVDPNSQFLGIAYSNRPESVATYKSFQFYSMSHEMFHCMGAFHNRENSGGGQHEYAHGVRVEGILRTIMSYPCSSSSCPRIPYLSAEAASYDGTPIGDSEHNNARMVAENIASVASWKASVGPPPTPSPVLAPTPSPVTTPTALAPPVTAASPNPPPVSPPVSPPMTQPVPPPVAPPVAPPTSSKNEESKKSCFSDKMAVLVQDKDGLTPINELQIGDSVLTSNGYSRVYSFGHYEPSEWTEFLQIYTADAQQSPLEITSDHLLYYHRNSTLNPELAPAGQVKVGDFLVTANGTPRKVKLIRKLHRQGIYAPFTESGVILVNGFAASNYIALPPAFQSHLSFEQQHWLQHKAYTPYRLFCLAVGCELDGNDSSGFAVGVSMWLPLLHWLERQNETGLRSFLYLVAVPLALGVQLIECMIFNVWHGIAAILGFSCLMKIWRKGAPKVQNRVAGMNINTTCRKV